MNSNAFQTLLTFIMVALGAVSTILLKMGCTADAAGNVASCDGSSVPTWLLPYTAIFILVAGTLKVIIGALQGKLFKPTAVVVPDGQGKPGVVTESQVAAPK